MANLFSQSRKKTAAKKTVQKKPLTPAEYKKLFDYIGKARTLALRISKDDKKRQDVRRAMASVEKKLWSIGNDYYWGHLTDFEAGAM